ncbi:Spy/CpxP family protein refolding chaperone [bacterium]|nr:Spy/CpxP family protein refolding chaperone [bacterium]
MKKLALLLCALCVITGSAHAAAVNNDNTNNLPLKKNPPTKEEMQKFHKAREAAFDQKLGLTEEQKVQARELRKQGFEKMKPVMDQIRQKKQELRTLKESGSISDEKKEALEKDLNALKKDADKIRKQNMKEFESILTKEQKSTLKQMKKEGRKHFEREHKHCPPPPCPKFEK